MHFDGLTVYALTEELKACLIGARIDKIHSPFKDSIVLHMRMGTQYTLLIRAGGSHPRMHLVADALPNPIDPSQFCMVLRKHLVGGRVIGIAQSRMDRIVEMEIRGWADDDPGQHRRLIIELTGRLANMVLVDGVGTITDALRRVDETVNRFRQIMPGLLYSPPPEVSKPNPLECSEAEFSAALERQSLSGEHKDLADLLSKAFLGIGRTHARDLLAMAGASQADRLTAQHVCTLYSSIRELSQTRDLTGFKFTVGYEGGRPQAFSCLGLAGHSFSLIKSFPSASSMLDPFYAGIDEYEAMDQVRRDMVRALKTHLDRCRRKLELQSEEYTRAEDASAFRRSGELILSNLHSIDEARVRQAGAGRTIVVQVTDYYDLDMREVPVEIDTNLSLSDNAHRYFARYARMQRARQAMAERLVATRNELSYLETVVTSLDNAETRDDVQEIRNELESLGYLEPRKSRRQSRELTPMPRKYLTKEGFEIYVGKNNAQNDHLTFKLAGPGDIWMHVKDMAGAHVVIRRKGGETVPHEVLRLAACLAAYYSKARHSSGVPVDYTERRNVRKPKGAKPGMVIYDEFSTVFVTPSHEQITAGLSSNTGNDHHASPSLR